MFGPKLNWSVESIKAHSKSRYYINGAFGDLLEFWKLTYSFLLGSETDFVWLIARLFFTWPSNTLEPENQYKQYRKKSFLPWCFVLLVINLLKSLNEI